MLGLATGLLFRVWALGMVSLLVVVSSAIALRGFGFAGGVSVMVGCLVVSQIAYVAGGLMVSRADNAEQLTQDEVDGDPNSRGEQNVSDEDK